MTGFSTDKFSILFNKNWSVSGLAKIIAGIDRDALCHEYRVLKQCAPRRSDLGKLYFVGHSGKLPERRPSNRFEERSAIALWNLNECWSRPGGGWFIILDYQFPLKARQSDRGIGKVDLLGITDQGQLMVIELKREGRNNLGETPAAALLQGLRYAAIVEANSKAIITDVENHPGDRFKDVKVTDAPPVIQVLAIKSWWSTWFNLGASTRRKVGDWEMEFLNLAVYIEIELGVTIDCMVPDSDPDPMIFGTGGRTPHFRQVPALYPVAWAEHSAPDLLP